MNAALPAALLRLVGDRLDAIYDIPGVDRVIIFGSYAKGTYGPASDLDVAVFFRAGGASLLEYYRILSRLCACPEIDIQVQAFSSCELGDPCGIIEEIITYGIDYPLCVALPA